MTFSKSGITTLTTLLRGPVLLVLLAGFLPQSAGSFTTDLQRRGPAAGAAAGAASTQTGEVDPKHAGITAVDMRPAPLGAAVPPGSRRPRPAATDGGDRHCPDPASQVQAGFVLSGPPGKRIAMIIGENEYRTGETLPEFARTELQPLGYEVAWVLSTPRDGDPEFHNAGAIRNADLVLVSVRRRTPPMAMMDLLRAHLAAGKPVVGIRTASHAFDAVPASTAYASWPTFDVDVLGGHYEGHYGNKPPDAPPTVVETVAANSAHAVLTGVPAGPFRVTSHLYKNRRLAPAAVILLNGRVDGQEAVEPVAWVNPAGGRRVFYTSLGNPDDFQLPVFRRLLRNGIVWALGDPLPPG